VPSARRAKGVITIDILTLIDQLEQVFDRGFRVPLSDKVAIDKWAFLNIVDQMRLTIPQEIKQARDVQLERDKYIAQAHDEAREIIAQAREDAAKLLDEHQLRRSAQAQAEAMITRARREALRIRAGAEEYAESQLKEMGRHVEQLQRVLRNGLTAIENRRSARLATASPASGSDTEKSGDQPKAHPAPETDDNPE
jgi:cell division septum initiation protein DivIVA